MSSRKPVDRDALADLAGARIEELTEELVQVIGTTVQAGPFAGMVLPDLKSWGGGFLAPKLLGCYEAELHDALEQAIARQPDVVINVGCAEGFYAIGLARRLPGARVFASDISTEAQRACTIAAHRNGVADRVTVLGECDDSQLVELASGCKRALLVIDCEGAEMQLLSAQAVPQLRHCDMIVELHDFVDRKISPTLGWRLTPTHDITAVREGPRDPAGIQLLQRLGSLERALLVCEGRPELMHWLVCTAR